MSFRNRPVLDRRHRPRWQDELRTQQLMVAGFALAIAVAVGIFAAASWSSFYESNLRQAALVDGTPVRRADIVQRIQIVGAELQALALDLQQHDDGGARSQVIQQQLSSIQSALQSVTQTGSDSYITGLVLQRRATELGGEPTAEELQAEIDKRRTQPARAELSLLLRAVEKAEGAKELTDADWAKAKADVKDWKAQLDAGADFGELATEHSDDPSAQQAGLLGWVESSDPQYKDYFTGAGDAEVGSVVGPLKSEAGWYLLKVEDREAAGRDQPLDEILTGIGVTDDIYRQYVLQEMLQDRAQDHFESMVEKAYQPQRKVAQIKVNIDQGFPLPKIRIRHLLVSPLAGASDQSKATDKQWAAARRTALELRREAADLGPDADWFELAEQSDDQGSASQGGFLGWYDPDGLVGQFVPPFAKAVAELEVGELSRPVRSKFGFHIIQVTEERISAGDQAQRLVTELRDDPDSFADVARNESEDVASAQKGGEVGWIIHYQYDQAREQAIFDLQEPGDISDPVVSNNALFIFKLLDTDEMRFVPLSQREALGTAGFTRWLQEIKDQAGVWLHAEFAPPTTAPA
jgi:parvulin-like peptidyl-prolyl isomerase